MEVQTNRFLSVILFIMVLMCSVSRRVASLRGRHKKESFDEVAARQVRPQGRSRRDKKWETFRVGEAGHTANKSPEVEFWGRGVVLFDVGFLRSEGKLLRAWEGKS